MNKTACSSEITLSVKRCMKDEKSINDPSMAKLERTQSIIQETLQTPGAVKINVQGAFIEEGPTRPPESPQEDGVRYDGQQIRLPNHREVVSHVALDVSFSVDVAG